MFRWWALTMHALCCAALVPKALVMGHAEAFTYDRALGVVATSGPIATGWPVVLTLVGRT